MVEDSGLAHSIRSAFGNGTYKDTGELDRGFLAQQVFHDPDKLALLDALVHPAVQRDFDQWVIEQRAPYVIKEAALIYEAGSDKSLDAVIVVMASEEERIGRIMHRDGVTREDVLSRMKNQWLQEEKVKRADFVIYNDGQQLVIPQVLAIHHELSVVGG